MRRRRAWYQDGERRVADPAEARAFIERVGVCTLYAASPEVPSLYQAHMSDPKPPTFATWDSPSGYVYTWRWEIGRPHAAFYGTLVARKPTWVAFDLLPSLLGGLMERRAPGELYERGELSREALRVYEAFEGTDGVLGTAELRERAGFPQGKESRAAYLKAVEELDSRLFLAKRFADGDAEDAMRHALIAQHYSEAHRAGLAMDPEEALADVLGRMLREAAVLDPKPLARHLRVPGERIEAALERCGARRVPVGKGSVYVTTEENE